MSKKNEITSTNSDFYAPTMSINGLYSDFLKANNHALDTYKDIIESPNVSEDIKNDFVEIHKERERTIRQETMMIIGGIIVIGVISAAYMLKKT